MMRVATAPCSFPPVEILGLIRLRLYGLLAEAETFAATRRRPELVSAYKAICENRLINAATIISDIMSPPMIQENIIDHIRNRYVFELIDCDEIDTTVQNTIALS